MPRINLLPWREQERKERQLQFFVALGAATVAALFVTGAGYLLMSGLISAQENRNATLQGEIRVLDRQIQEINDLETQKQRFVSRMEIIETLQRSRSEIVHMFDEITSVMPDGTFLTAFTQGGSKLKLEGVAQSSTRVSTLIRNITASQWLREPELEVIENRRDSTLGNSFVLHAQQVDTSGQAATSTAAATSRSTSRGSRPATN